MFAIRSHVRIPPGPSRLPRSAACGWCCSQVRGYADTSDMIAKVYQPVEPIAKELASFSIFHRGARGPRAWKGKVDNKRVNIVSEKLCDDVIEYMKPSLMRHQGCDIIDLYPGTGLFSKRLHTLLKPRSHILMEPDDEFYAPYLEPLLKQPGTKLLPKSGIVWEVLNSVLNAEHLPHQVEWDQKTWPPPRNDSLLMVANLGFYPPRRYMTFDSITKLLLHQMISSIRSMSLFQKYGLVRLLIWVPDNDKLPLLPRTVHQRRRAAIDAELACESITEICGPDYSKDLSLAKEDPSFSGWYQRDRVLDLYSAGKALDRMRAAGIEPFPGRESSLLKEVLEREKKGERRADPLLDPPVFLREYTDEFRELQARDEKLRQEGGEGLTNRTGIGSRYRGLVSRMKVEDRRQMTAFETLKARDALSAELVRQSQEPNPDPAAVADLAARIAAWNDDVGSREFSHRNTWILHRDQVHAAREGLMLWDRRRCEPMVARNEEFFPGIAMSLLDIQPRDVHPSFLGIGPYRRERADNPGETFALILSILIRESAAPATERIRNLYHGAGILNESMSSLQDPLRGGRNLGKWDEMNTRCMNEVHFVELMEAYMKWPFRPTFAQLALAEGSTDDIEAPSSNTHHEMN